MYVRHSVRDAIAQEVRAALLAEQAKVAPAPPESKTKRRIELAKASYDEVLDATKHQDDKVGRFLTAIAFLTTGAITLIARDRGISRPFHLMDGADHPLLAWSTGAFFALTLSAVALLLLCLSVPVRLPQTGRDPMKNSHLFYNYIAAKPRGEWQAEWKTDTDETLEEAIAYDYVREAHNLAERASAKYRHTFEASWLFTFALLFLGISIFLKISAFFQPASNSSAAELGFRHLIILAMIASIHAGLQVYTRAVHDLRSTEKARDYDARSKVNGGQFPVPSRADYQTSKLHAEAVKETRAKERNAASYEQRRWTWTLLVASVAYSVIVALPVNDWVTCGRCAYWVVGAAIAIAVGGPMVLTRDRWHRQTSLQMLHWRAWWLGLLVTASAVALGLLALYFDGLTRVLVILAPATFMSVVNASRPARAHHRMRKFERNPDRYSED